MRLHSEGREAPVQPGGAPLKEAFVFFAVTLVATDLLLWGPFVIFGIPAVGFQGGSSSPAWAIAMFILGGFVPSIAALILTAIKSGRQGTRNLLRRVVRLRIGWRNYLVIVGVVAAGTAGQIGIMRILGHRFDMGLFIAQLPTLAPLLVLGPLSEELGWRGYAQDRLQSRLGPRVAGLIIGVVWAVWHLPLFLMVGTTQHDLAVPFVGFLVGTVSTSVIYSWLHGRTGGSIWTAVMLHWVYTYALQVISTGAPRSPAYNWLEYLPYVVIAGAVVVLGFRKPRAAGSRGEEAPTAPS